MVPIYEYECTNCHHKFDRLQKMNAEPVEMCPECTKNTVRRLVSAAGFQLKGTGWYVTDFKNPPKKEGEGHVKTDVSKETKPSESSPVKKEETPSKKEKTKDKA